MNLYFATMNDFLIEDRAYADMKSRTTFLSFTESSKYDFKKLDVSLT